MIETGSCSICGRVLPMDELTTHDERQLCDRCLTAHTTECEECGRQLWNSETYGTEDTHLCQSCYSHQYTHCDQCGALLRLEDALYVDGSDNPLCIQCYQEEMEDRCIQSYYYKPAPIFHGDGSRCFGVELEIDGAGESNSNAWRLLEIANQCGMEHLYCKHDGSLDDGFELVTHPMTLRYHLEEMPWKSILAEAVRMGYRSHQTSTCGLHVHISREAFGETAAEQDEVIARILYFVEKFWEELLKFSRRTPRQLERWAARYGWKEKPREILEKAKKGSGDRYTCINLQNYSTIEFRFFRGTLKLNTLIATLQFLDRICDVALFLSDEELSAMSWTTFVAGCYQNELVRYLKERRLYVNEPVEAEEEV